ncbi:MAG: hypothetical protein NTY94_17440 [Alphaproteobacteria bacterium]|nr:hypothetical protein [Alphaproteobacteria bacterium]
MRSITDHLTLLVDLLKRAIGVHLDRQARLRPHVPTMGLGIDYTPPQPPPGPAPLPQQAYELLWHRAHRIAHRFLALFARWQSNTLPTSRIRPKTTRKPTTRTTLRLPRAFGWANHRLPEAAPAAGYLEDLVINRAAELRPFLQAAPQAARLLRPLCTALGIRPPEYLALPPRPRKPRAPKPPKPRRPSLNDPGLRWRPWERPAIRAFHKKFGRD